MTPETTPRRPRQIHIGHRALVRAPGLLPMRYTLREIAAELGIPLPTLISWRARGLPCHKDGRGHVWVIGDELARWLRAQRAARRTRLLPGQAYCVGCNAAVAVVEPQIERVPQGASTCERLCGRCPTCGRTVYRVIKRWSTATTTDSPSAS